MYSPVLHTFSSKQVHHLLDLSHTLLRSALPILCGRCCVAGASRMTRLDLENGPNTQVLCLQWGAVTALRLVKEHCLQSGGADGRLCLWDVRRLQQPLHSLQTPDSG